MPADVCHIVREYVRLSYHAMRANHQGFNVTLHEQYQEGLPPVMVIPQDLSRAVLNVMNNACYAVWKKAQASTKSSKEEYKPEISISVALNSSTPQLPNSPTPQLPNSPTPQLVNSSSALRTMARA